MNRKPTQPDLEKFNVLSREVNERFEQLSQPERAGLFQLLPVLSELVRKIRLNEDQSALPVQTEPEPQNDPCVREAHVTFRQDFEKNFQTILALLESEASFRQLAEFSPYAIVVQTDGVIVFHNPAALKMYGAERPDQLLGKLVGDFKQPEAADWRVLADTGDGIRRAEGEFTRLDGEISCFEALSVPMFFNGRASFLHMANDTREFWAARMRQVPGEEHFQTLFHSAPVGIVLTQDSKILFANEAFLDIFGYPTGLDLAGRSIAEFYSPAIYSLDEHAHLRQMGKAVPAPFEFIGRKLDGSVVNLHLQGAPLKMAGGEAYLAYIFDITAQKETQRQLERYRALAENTNDIMLFVRLSDGKIIDANLAACQAYGYTYSEMLTLQLVDVRAQPDVEQMQRQMERASQDSIRFESRHIRKNGEIFPVEVSSQGITMGGERLLLSVIRDITDRSLANLAIQESEARYRSLVEGLPDIVYSYSDRRGGIYYSARVKEILGYSAEELLQAPFLWNQSIHPEDRMRIQSVIEGLNPFDLFEIEYRITDRQGNLHWFYDRALSCSAVAGEVIIEGFATDITDRKRTEADLYRQIMENTQHLAELQALMEVSAAMRQAQNRPEMISLIVRQSMSALHAQSGGLALLNGDELVVQETIGVLVDLLGHKVLQDRGILWQVIRSGKPRFIEDLNAYIKPEMHAEFIKLKTQISAGILQPVKNGNLSIGLLFFGFTQPQQFMEHQKRLITAIAEMTGSALHRMNITAMLEEMVAARGRDLESIYRVTSAASETLVLPVALQKALEITLAAVDSRMGGIYLFDEASNQLGLAAQLGLVSGMQPIQKKPVEETSLEGWVLLNKKPIYLNDVSEDPRAAEAGLPAEFLAYFGMPMRLRERVLGVLSIYKSGGAPLNLEEVTLLSFIADHLGLVVENVGLFHRSEQNAVFEERSRLARELHDSVTQSLYSASLFSAGAKEFAAQGNIEQAVQYINQIGVISQQALRDMRLLVYELRSPTLDAMGLVGALQNRLDAVERRSGIDTIFRAADLPRLIPKVEENLYRIALEALNNSLKHASASRVELFLSLVDERVCLKLKDNGTGFDLAKAAHSGGVGMVSMRERTEQMGGHLFVESDPRNGTTIEVCVPLEKSLA